MRAGINPNPFTTIQRNSSTEEQCYWETVSLCRSVNSPCVALSQETRRIRGDDREINCAESKEQCLATAACSDTSAGFCQGEL
ncbi:hypothetical protein ACOMHN_010495 [Nucella lapillus]